MDNRKWQAAASATPPADEASPSSGYPTDGNPSTPTPATIPGARWFHQVGEEIRAVIEEAGLVPSSTTLTQLRDAIKRLITSGDFKDSVRAATTANITLSGAQTIDGVSVVAGDRVLVKDQTTGADNGIYVAAAGAWARATDADTGAELSAGATVPVEEGTVNADTLWMLTNNGTVTIGTTALVFALKTVPTGEQVFTSSGTFTVPAGITRIRVRCWGGGGAGGSSGVGGNVGGGGGGGSYAEGFYTVVPGTQYSVTVGVGGTGVSGAGGNNGLTSSFGALCSATGGSGGPWGDSGTTAGGSGGVGSGGTSISISGGQGGGNIALTIGLKCMGGGAFGTPMASLSGTGSAGLVPAGGGCGASGGSNLAGGAGGNGKVIVSW